MFPYSERPKFTVDPEVQAMLDDPNNGLPQPPAEDAPEQPEADTRTTLEKDLEIYRSGIALWKETVRAGMVSSEAEVPSDYRFGTNTLVSPYSMYAVEILELQRRGAPIVLCTETSEATGSMQEGYMSVYKRNGVPLDYPILTNSASKFARIIEKNGIYDFHFDNDWRKFTDFPAASKDPDAKTFQWAEHMGIMKPGFMAVYLARKSESDEDVEQTITSQPLYEQLAAEQDAKGFRKNVPLSIEAYSSLVMSGLQAVFTANPELNEAYKLTRPFLPRITEESDI